MKNEAKRNEQVRRAVLGALATRHPAAFDAHMVAKRVKWDDGLESDPTQPSDEETEGALELLKGKGLVEEYRDGLGSTRYWRATSEGVLQWERGIL